MIFAFVVGSKRLENAIRVGANFEPTFPEKWRKEAQRELRPPGRPEVAAQ
jgi:hypothetical protein